MGKGRGVNYFKTRRKKRFERRVEISKKEAAGRKLDYISFWWQGEWHTPRPYLTPPRREGSYGSGKQTKEPAKPVVKSKSSHYPVVTPDNVRRLLKDAVEDAYITPENTKTKRGRVPQHPSDVEEMAPYVANYCAKGIKQHPTDGNYCNNECIIHGLCISVSPGKFKIREMDVSSAFNRIYGQML